MDLSIYQKIFSKLNQNRLGYGLDVRDPELKKDWSSAYGLIASAELNLNQLFQHNKSTENIEHCISWLIKNKGCKSTHAPCWGVPFKRSIWTDQEPVKENTSFAIPTCHAIQALCEFYESNNRNNEILKIANDAAIYFAKNCYDKHENNIAFWYSPLEQHSFHVNNSISMLAGIIQKVHKLSQTNDLLEEQATKAISYILKTKKNVNGLLGWNYFGLKIPPNKTNRPNDLLHDAFMCHGLIEYKQNNGSISNRYTYEELYNSFKKFIQNDIIYEFPIEYKIQSEARLWGISHGLYIVSRLEKILNIKKNLSEIFYKVFQKYYMNENLSILMTPKGAVADNHVRQIAHTLLGISYYLNI